MGDLSAGVGAHAVGDEFEEALGGDAGWGFDVHARDELSGDAGGEGFAFFDGEIECTGEEGFDDVEVGGSEAGDGVGGQGGLMRGPLCLGIGGEAGGRGVGRWRW